MTNPESVGDPSTPEQAGALYRKVSWINSIYGEYLSGGEFGYRLMEVPSIPTEVAKHLPPLDGRQHPRYFLDILQTVDFFTHEPDPTFMREDRGAADIVFMQAEPRPNSLPAQTKVDYRLTTDDGALFRLERHLTDNGELLALPTHRTEPMPEINAEDDVELIYRSAIAHYEDRARRVEGMRELERSLGILTVSRVEADQVLSFLDELGR